MPKRAPQQIFARRIGGKPGLAEKLLDLVGHIPAPRESRHADPAARAQVIARTAAIKAAAAAGTLALPPGPLGWATIAPELYAVWKIQAQMVADIAGAYGKTALLTREQMLYSLFSHTAASAFRNLVVNVGERYLVRRAPLSALYAIGNKVALRVAQRSAGRVVTRWVPALGALGVAGFVYLDTGHVADTTIALFSADVRIEGEVEVEGADAMADAEATRTRRARKAPPKARRATSQAKPAPAAARRTPPPANAAPTRTPRKAPPAPARGTASKTPRRRRTPPGDDAGS